MPAKPPTTDVHAHALVPGVESLVAGRAGLKREQRETARRLGAESLAVTERVLAATKERLTDLGTRLAAMDAASVDVQLVSPSPTQYYYWAAPGLAREIWTATHEGIAALCQAAPRRLAGLGTVPLQHPQLAAAALEHAVLECGLQGIEISSWAPAPDGRIVDLSDPGLDGLWARAEELDAVVFLHPMGCTVDGRLDRWYLENVVGQPLEHTIALSHLIFSGVLDRHPRLRLLASHGGGYLPTYLGRSDHAWRERPEARGCLLPPSAYMRRIAVDALVYSPDALRGLVDVFGAERVLIGSDYPFDMGVTDPVSRLDAAGLADRDRELIAGGNAARWGLLP
ncbi:amidohydrolase family protein [Streptomyces sp. NPDC048155]|uniref:amidohydrolase family protein n=1 Tax=Streptomyces sp. NPDC048155 TaxID=3154818 RepID=UPI0033E21F40